MTQHANLRRDFKAILDLVKTPEHLAQACRRVVDGVKTNQHIARSVGQALKQRGRDSFHVVRRMVGLESCGKRASTTDRRVARGFHTHLVGRVDQIEVRHQFANAGDHFAGHAAAQSSDILFPTAVTQNILPQLRHAPICNMVIDLRINRVLIHPGNLILFIRNNRVFPQITNKQAAQNLFGRDAFQIRLRGNTG